MEDFWGVVISMQLLVVIAMKFYRVVKDWGKPNPVTTSEILYIVDMLGLSDKKAKEVIEKLLESNNLDLKNFFVEENRKKEKRAFDKEFNKNRDND